MLPFPRIQCRYLRPLLIPLRFLRRLVPVLNDVDIVHFHDIDLLPLMSMLCVVRPVVYDVHENYAEEMLVREWIPRPLRRLCYLLVRAFYCLCGCWHGVLQGIYVGGVRIYLRRGGSLDLRGESKRQ